MSIKCMSRVWETANADGPHLLALLALADYANDDGLCYPSVETLSKKIRRKTRATQLVISEMCARGELYVVSGGGRKNTNLYLVCCGRSVQDLADVLTSRMAGLTSEKALEVALEIDKKRTQYREKGCNPLHRFGEKEKVQPTAEKVQLLAERVQSVTQTVQEVAPKPLRTVIETPIEPSVCAARTARRAQKPKQPDSYGPLFVAIAEICKLDCDAPRSRRAISETAKFLAAKAGIEVRHVAGFGEWFAQNDFRGQRGAPPTPAQVQELWRQYAEGVRTKSPSTASANGARPRGIDVTMDTIRRMQERYAQEDARNGD